MRRIWFGAALAMALAAMGCAGDTGAQGQTGGQGTQGPPGPVGSAAGPTFGGKVNGPSGPVAAGTPVVAYLLDRDGHPVAQVGAALTDASGDYSIVVDGVTGPSSSVMLEALLSGPQPM